MTEKEINEASERGTAMAQPRRAPSEGSAASPYVVKRRESDDRWCIYLRRWNCVVAEFGAANSYDAETIKEILEGAKPPNDEAQARGREPERTDI